MTHNTHETVECHVSISTLSRYEQLIIHIRDQSSGSIRYQEYNFGGVLKTIDYKLLIKIR